MHLSRIFRALKTALLIFIWSFQFSPLRAAESGENLRAELHLMGPKTLETLSWIELTPEVQVIENRRPLAFEAVVKGRLLVEDQRLLIGSTQVQRSALGEFEAKIELIGPVTIFNIRSINLDGSLIEETWMLLLPNYEELKKMHADGGVSRFRSLVAVGPTLLSYKEQGKSDYSATTVTAKAGMSYLFSPSPWEVGFLTYGTVLPITKNQEVTARFIGGNLRLGYRLKPFARKWTITLSGGVYYTTMLVSPALFGFKDLAGPQVLPAVRFRLDEQSTLGAYLKFAPVTDRSTVLSISNHEIAIGMDYSIQSASKGSWHFSMDFAMLNVVIQQVKIETQSMTLAVGMGF